MGRSGGRDVPSAHQCQCASVSRSFRPAPSPSKAYRRLSCQEPLVAFRADVSVNIRGTILVMHKPRMIYVPDQFFTASSSQNIPILKGKAVVHRTWNCPGYSMYYFSDRRGYSRSLLPHPDVLTRVLLGHQRSTLSLCSESYQSSTLQLGD